MINLYASFSFLFGLAIGSFANVVILRFHSGRGIDGRSGCFSCGRELPWYELLPLVSYLFLRGKCSSCKSKISRQYPLVELAVGLLTAYLFQRYITVTTINFYQIVILISSIVVWFSLIVIFVYDLRHKIIPDLFSFLFSASALIAVTFISIGSDIFSTLIHHLLAAALISGFFYLIWAISRGRWMGFGDVKLSFGIGLYLGIARGLSAIAFGFWIGAIYALIMLGLQRVLGKNQLSLGQKTLTMKSEVPFAPFLILGTLLAFVLFSDIFHISYFFNV